MRRNIFELLKQKENLEIEIDRIEELCEEDSIYDGRYTYALEEFVDEFCLKEWKNRNRCISCEQMRKKLGIYIINKVNFSEEIVLIYLEYMINIIYLANKYISVNGLDTEQSYQFLQENVTGLIDDLGYEIKVLEDKEMVLLIEKDSAATAVAEILEPELAYEVLEYNHHILKGDIERKKKILKVLADEFEALRPQIKGINVELESNIGFALNKMNIRHNNMVGKNAIEYVKNLTRDELEDWYDEIYQMLLLSFLEVDNIERNKKVKHLKETIENNK